MLALGDARFESDYYARTCIGIPGPSGPNGNDFFETPGDGWRPPQSLANGFGIFVVAANPNVRRVDDPLLLELERDPVVDVVPFALGVEDLLGQPTSVPFQAGAPQPGDLFRRQGGEDGDPVEDVPIAMELVDATPVEDEYPIAMLVVPAELQPVPNAALPRALAAAPVPIAMPVFPDAFAVKPIAIELSLVEVAPLPIAIEWFESGVGHVATRPIAIEATPSAVEAVPIATEELLVAGHVQPSPTAVL